MDGLADGDVCTDRCFIKQGLCRKSKKERVFLAGVFYFLYCAITMANKDEVFKKDDLVFFFSCLYLRGIFVSVKAFLCA
jgi:hypothetical protein